MAQDTDAMTPAQAAEVLRGIDGYEERLTLRAAGLTLMVWGIVTPGIFLTYGTADPFLEERGLTWLYTLLWAPWIIAGSLTTAFLWRAHALSLRQPPDGRKGALTLAATLGAFFIICFALFASLDLLLHIEWTVSSLMVVVNGVFAGALFLILRGMHGYREKNILVAGLAMLLIGITLGTSGIPIVAADLLGALTVGTAWLTAGAATYARG